MPKLTIITDAYHPQINGVVRTLDMTMDVLKRWDWQVQLISPNDFKTFAYPPYPEIQIPLSTRRLKKMIREFSPDYIHIATESRLGLSARNFCIKNKLSFTTCYHTKFPEYAYEHYGIDVKWGYKYMRWFHGKSSAVMVNTETLRSELTKRRLTNLKMWGRGVDTTLFKPYPKLDEFRRPIFLYVGRVSAEKNLPDFLSLELPGTKVVVGDGPILADLRHSFPTTVFLGAKHGEELAQMYSQGDVFVFPSKSDTFGLVLLEALACAVPIAAYNVAGPRDVIQPGVTGILDDDLKAACLKALTLNSADCLAYARAQSWEDSTQEFINNLVPCF